MNANEKVNSWNMVSKIATVINLFKAEFPDSVADLSPWLKNPETEKFHDPYSVDLAFHFSRRSCLCQSYCILMQIRLSSANESAMQRIIEIELSGHDYMGQQWQFATIEHGKFHGVMLPLPEAEQKIRHICRQILSFWSNVDF
ncbi:hypothetical protein [Nostoc sp. UHCC 0870]|uniref:hypothetical protein n=1 Tax=Nostoc sp. UHCC 0870 TaxID=2914041 RepID=UPI001EDC9DBC|nr:hypothetical protein [Nostoc sp. UHCC 0870]UKO96876.1 hypothetical protein L6494_20045 [Nostoc sp. UHCC 0870]